MPDDEAKAIKDLRWREAEEVRRFQFAKAKKEKHRTVLGWTAAVSLGLMLIVAQAKPELIRTEAVERAGEVVTPPPNPEKVIHESPSQKILRIKREKAAKAQEEKLEAKRKEEERIAEAKRLEEERVTREHKEREQTALDKQKAQTWNGAFWVREWHCGADEYTEWAEGSITNVSGTSYRYVSITLSELDDQENLVGTAMDNIAGIEPGQTWKFKAMFTDDRTKSVKIKDISGI